MNIICTCGQAASNIKSDIVVFTNLTQQPSLWPFVYPANLPLYLCKMEIALSRRNLKVIMPSSPYCCFGLRPLCGRGHWSARFGMLAFSRQNFRPRIWPFKNFFGKVKLMWPEQKIFLIFVIFQNLNVFFKYDYQTIYHNNLVKYHCNSQMRIRLKGNTQHNYICVSFITSKFSIFYSIFVIVMM